MSLIKHTVYISPFSLSFCSANYGGISLECLRSCSWFGLRAAELHLGHFLRWADWATNFTISEQGLNYPFIVTQNGQKMVTKFTTDLHSSTALPSPLFPRLLMRTWLQHLTARHGMAWHGMAGPGSSGETHRFHILTDSQSLSRSRGWYGGLWILVSFRSAINTTWSLTLKSAQITTILWLCY